MRDRAINFYRLFVFAACLFIFTSRAHAVPPEGLEAFALLNKEGKPLNPVYALIGNTAPVWADSYTTFETYASVALGGNYFSFGGDLTVGNKLGDRDGYFLRYDETFFRTHSISFKLTHTDYRYIAAGKNVLSLDYNGSFHLGASTQFYILAGLFYRFTLNSWNTPTGSPLNFNTEDQEYAPDLCLGFKFMVSSENFLTVDVNNRTPFSSENLDDVGLDFTFNFKSSSDVTWRLSSSTRFSGVSGATADVGEQSFLIGFRTAF